MNPARSSKNQTKANEEKWLPFSVLMTVLFGLFVVLYSIALKQKKDPPPVAATQSNGEKKENDIGSALAASLNEKFKGTELSGTYEIVFEKRGIVVRMQSAAFFEAGSAALVPRAKTFLENLIPTLKELNYPIKVEGHTDPSPISSKIYASNWELSASRAASVVRYFINEAGLIPARFEASGLAEFRPVHSNDSVLGQNMNRRVDLVILLPVQE